MRRPPWLSCSPACSPPTACTPTAPPADDADLIRQLFLDGGVDESWIAPVARAQLTPALVAAAVGRVVDEAGPLVSVARDGDNWVVTFDNGTSTVFLARGDDGLISGLFVSALLPADTSLDQPVAALAALPGDTALVIVRGRTGVG